MLFPFLRCHFLPTVIVIDSKDFVLLYQIEQLASHTAAKLAQFHALRNDAGDIDEARRIVGESQQKAYTDGSILNGMFSEDVLANIDSKTGLFEARAGWGQGLSELSGVKSFLDGRANPLGFDDGFLALVQCGLPAVGQATNDSYDYFESWLLPAGTDGSASGSLGDAWDKYVTAKESYENYWTYTDQISTELEAQRRQFADRLRAIAGADFPDPPDPTAPYHHPELNTGGEIYMQIQSMQQAQLKIRRNKQEIQNIHAQVMNEIERRGTEAGVSNLIQDTYIQYGNMQASLTESIAAIEAYQAYTNQLADGADSWLTSLGGGTAAHAYNAVVQVAAEISKGSLKAEKERLSAEQEATIVFLNDKISAANSTAHIKDLLLNLHTLAIESQEAALTLAQESSRLQALFDERAYFEKEWAKAEKGLSKRYFADPTHRIILNHNLIEAGLAFERARLAVYMMARALDYKWNTYVQAEGSDGKTYSSTTVFKLRNADELLEMAKAFCAYNKFNAIGVRQGEQFVKFSLREDFLGFRRQDFIGNTLTYPDPATGKMVDAITAFRSYIKNIAPHGPPSNVSLSQIKTVVRLQFSTTKTNFDGTFFSPGRWNEKIKWLQVNINSTTSTIGQLMVWLEQSGSGFIRNQTAGTPDPAHPDRIVGEMTTYPTSYWYQETNPVTKNVEWKSKNTFGCPINASVIKDPNAPNESLRKAEFQEMPPAISTWILEIPIVHSNGMPMLDLDQLNDVEIWFYNYYKTRN